MGFTLDAVNRERGRGNSELPFRHKNVLGFTRSNVPHRWFSSIHRLFRTSTVFIDASRRAELVAQVPTIVGCSLRG